MTNGKKTLFISDLHLDEKHPDIAAIFLSFLQNQALSADALYILGDLFETWIGDDDKTPFNSRIIDALRQATDRGLPIYVMVGNRDYLLSTRFARETGCQLLPDELVIHLYGTPILLMHGDTLCTQDVKYLTWRKRLRHPLVLMFFPMLPISLRRKIAGKIRKESTKHTRSTQMNIMDVTQQEVEHVMQHHQVNVLIHGHTHRPAIHELTLNDQSAKRIVLDAWHNHGSVLVWEESKGPTVYNLPPFR